MSRNRRNRNRLYPRSFRGDSQTTGYYESYLWGLIKSRWVFHNLPDTWNEDYIKAWLFKRGYLGMVEKNGNTYCIDCGFSKINVYNQPIEINVANPVLGSFNQTIGVECELLYFDYNGLAFNNLVELVRITAEKLANCDCSINVNLVNSRVAHVFECDSDADKATYEKMYDMVSSGEPAVFVKKSGSEITSNSVMQMNVKNTYIANDVFLTKNSIMQEFCTVIGLNNANTDKRERLNSDEVHVNDDSIKAIFENYRDTLNQCFSRFNELYGTEIRVELRGDLYVQPNEFS